MATLIRRFYQGYRYLNEELSDPRTQNYFLMSSPWACIGIIAFYLYFVYELGPNFMAKRKPFHLDRIIQIYNALQIVSCSFLLHQALSLAWLNDYTFCCHPIDYSDAPTPTAIARTVYYYFLLKMFDLFDTVFFVLRKKQNQVSFLHVYHHAGMTFGSWVATKFMAGGHVTFLGAINSFVHVVMYTYYLVTSLGINRPWWKKHITQLQLFQFFVLLVQYVLMLCVKDCPFPRWTAAVMIPQNLFMVVLFGDFYYKAYVKKSAKKASQNGFSSDASNGKLKSQ